MTVTDIKKIKIELSDEEIQTLEKARKVVNALRHTITCKNCAWVSYNDDVEGNGYYSTGDLTELEITLEELQKIEEIF